MIILRILHQSNLSHIYNSQHFQLFHDSIMSTSLWKHLWHRQMFGDVPKEVSDNEWNVKKIISVLRKWTPREVQKWFYSIILVSKFIPLAQNPLQDNSHNDTDEGWRKYHCNYTDEKKYWGSTGLSFTELLWRRILCFQMFSFFTLTAITYIAVTLIGQYGSLANFTDYA